MSRLRKWLKIAAVGMVCFGILLASIVGAGAGANVLQSSEPLIQISEGQQKHAQQVANRWEDDQKLTEEQKLQVRERGIELSHGLLEAIWEFTNIPFEKSAEVLKPEDVRWVTMEKTIVRKYPDGREETQRQKVVMLSQARTYNGLHRIRYELQTTVTQEGDVEVTTTEPVAIGEDWDKDYSRINKFLASAGFLTKEDRLLIYRQALAYDPTFGDPEAQDILLEEIGGGLAAGTVPQPMPLPPEEITRALKEAIRLTGVSESNWLPGLQWMVMRESGGNAHAYNQEAVWYSAAWGYQHAEGLLQLMPPTFFAHKLPGHEDIWNPVDNAAAAIRYIQGKYRSIERVPGIFTAAYRGY